MTKRAGRRWMACVVLGVCGVLAGCGVPRSSLDLIRAEAAATMPADDAGVRAALRREAATWGDLAGRLRERELGGLAAVDPRFVDLVDRAAAVARRQEARIEAGQDDPAKDRALLEEFGKLWNQAKRYLDQ